jgi:hypothetical protein
MDFTNLVNRPTLKVRHTHSLQQTHTTHSLLSVHSFCHVLTHALQRSYDTMAQASAPPQFLDYAGASRAPQDEHYQNHEHRPQRRRLEDPWRQRLGRHHYPGDGYDFRRPIMSGATDTIDLTEDRDERGISQHHMALPAMRDAAAGTEPATSSRAQRMPRFPRNIIDLADSDEEDDEEQGQQRQPVQRPAQRQRVAGNSQMPIGDDLFMPQMEEEGDDSLFIPLAPTRPATAGQRRPGFPQRLTPAMNFDEVEIVSSRPISRNISRRGTPAVFMPGQPAARDTPLNADATIDLTADDDDDEVILTDARPRHGINGELPAMAGSAIRNRERHHAGGDFGIARLYQRIRGQNAAAVGFLGDYMRQPYLGDDDDDAARIRAAQAMARGRADHARGYRIVVEGDVAAAARPDRRRPIATAIPNMMMNYGEVGFDLGLQMRVAEPATPKYEPPPLAAKGFTRSPTEDEEVVCPNCGDELAVGKDEIKQQIWVVKSCGHVSECIPAKHALSNKILTRVQAYCGECATRTRTTTTSKKGKGKASDPSIPPPLKKCVVVGCEKSATKKDLIHVYMSS